MCKIPRSTINQVLENKVDNTYTNHKNTLQIKLTYIPKFKLT